mgnify:CR=1 FL=1
MQLDFTAIRGNLAEKPLEAPVTAFREKDNIEVPTGAKSPQKAPQRATEGEEKAGRLIAQYKQEQAEHERTLAIYREYQHNIKESGSLRTAILKGAKAGEPPVALLLKAVKCISLMTGDTVFYSQLEGDIRAIYGAGLQEAPALQIELQQVQRRYKKLLEALEREPDGDSRERIKRAVKAHENRIAELEALIAKGAESKAS